MRHRKHGRKLGRNASHRKALFRNMASHLIRSVRIDEDDEQKPKVPGRIVTTLAKAKELRPTWKSSSRWPCGPRSTRKTRTEFHTNRPSGTPPSGRNGAIRSSGTSWNQAIAPAVGAQAPGLLDPARSQGGRACCFNELAERFADRPGGYTRVVRLAEVRLGDAGRKAIIEFTGERDRAKWRGGAPPRSSTDKGAK